MKKRKFIFFWTIVSLLAIAIIAVGAQPFFSQNSLQKEQFSGYVLGEAIVGFYGPLPYVYQNMAEKIRSKYNMGIKTTIDELCMVVYTDVDENTFTMLKRDPDIKFVERNHIAEWLQPNDPEWENQWGPQRIGCPDVWDQLTTGSADITVAVIDSGIDVNHPDLGNYVGGYDWENHDPIPDDQCGHGTHVAGIIAAEANNNAGIAGIAWNLRLLSEKVGTNYPQSDWIIQGIVHAVNNGADIINMSFGAPNPNAGLEQAIRFAYNQGCLLVAASGNFDSAVDYPARYSEVIAVGAVNQEDNRCTEADWDPDHQWSGQSGSNYGNELELVAPGNCILSTMPTYNVLFNDHENYPCNQGNDYQQDYDYMNGTSMACPHVVGVAALMWAINPDLTNEEIRCILQSTADDQVGNPTEDTPGHDHYYGYGLVDAFEAVSAANFRYSIEVTPNAQVIPVSGSVAFSVQVTLIQGVPQPVHLALDPYYPCSTLTCQLADQTITPTDSTTLTVSLNNTSPSQLETILRVIGTTDIAGCDTICHSNFFTVSIDPLPAADLAWIKTSPMDNGTVDPRLGDLWKSPWIWSDPVPPHIGEENELHVWVGNMDTNTESGPVLVKPYFNKYPFTIPVNDFPSLETKTIDNILPGGYVEKFWDNWEIPEGWPEHFCVFVQAWRPGFEDFDDSFNINSNNNIASKNFIGVYTGSPYTTIFTFENPTAKPMEIIVYMTPPHTDWTVDLCMPSREKGGTVITPLLIPPYQDIDLELTINPGREEEGEVDIWYAMKGYEALYPEFSKFTFNVMKKEETGGDPPIYENIMVFPTPERFIGTDLNQDGDTNDTILRYRNLKTGEVINTELITTGDYHSIDIYDHIIVFVGKDSQICYYDITTDTVEETGITGMYPSIHESIITFSSRGTIYYIDLNTQALINTGFKGHSPCVHDDLIVFCGSPERTLFTYDLTTGITTDTGIPGWNPTLYGTVCAFTTSEDAAAQDLNGDGDTKDCVIRYYDLKKKTITNTGIVGEYPVLQGDRIAFTVNEQAINEDLNGDGILLGRVIHYCDLRTGHVVNTHQLGTEPDIFEDTITFYVWERWKGQDLNRDGDQNDPIVNTYRIAVEEMSMAGVECWMFLVMLLIGGIVTYFRRT